MSNFCDPMDCSLPGSSVHGNSEARILEWVAISTSKGSSQPTDWTPISYLPGGFFATKPPVVSPAWKMFADGSEDSTIKILELIINILCAFIVK